MPPRSKEELPRSHTCLRPARPQPHGASGRFLIPLNVAGSLRLQSGCAAREAGVTTRGKFAVNVGLASCHFQIFLFLLVKFQSLEKILKMSKNVYHLPEFFWVVSMSLLTAGSKWLCTHAHTLRFTHTPSPLP